jgi:hypothetical protein
MQRSTPQGPNAGCFVALGAIVLGLALAFWSARVGIPLVVFAALALARILARDAQLERNAYAQNLERLRAIAPPVGDAWRALLVAEGLGDLVPLVEPNTRPAVRLATRRIEEIERGRSRVGGVPDLPPSKAWPRRHGVPLAFLAQIDLSEAAPHLPQGLLPPSGHLWFFCDVQGWPDGSGPDDGGGGVVLYEPAGVALEPAIVPKDLPAKGRFPLCAVTMEGYLDIPDSEDAPRVAEWLDDNAKSERYMAIRSFLSTGGTVGDAHKLLGWANPVQGSMEPGFPGRLLLQVESDNNAGMMWGDAGLLYFWIRDQDLRAAVFDRTWTILQCA